MKELALIAVLILLSISIAFTLRAVEQNCLQTYQLQKMRGY